MARDPQSRDKFRRPEIFLADVLNKEARGDYLERDEYVPFLYRALVVAVDVEGGKLENPSGSGTVKHTVGGKTTEVQANIGPENPRNSIKARILTEAFDQFISDERLRVFWPFFPDHFATPVKPGEYVYVVFEDGDFDHGLWVSKLPGHNNLNFFKGEESLKTEGGLSNKFGDKPTEDTNLDTNEAAAESKAGDRLQKAFGD